MRAGNRRNFEIVHRADSNGTNLRVGVFCKNPNRPNDPADVSADANLQPGERVVIDPIVGHECTIETQRDDAVAGQERHLAGGYFDPLVDPSGTSALDIETAMETFTMPSRDLGFAVYLPRFDQQVLWTYAYGVGSPTPGTRTVRLDCPNPADDRTYDIYYGNWVRSVVPRGSPCQIIHRTPAGAIVTGFGTYEPNGSGRFNPPSGPSETIYYGGLQPTSVVVVYDIYPHPSEHNGAFARQQYLDFLGRALRLVFQASPVGFTTLVALFVTQGIALGVSLEVLRRLVELLVENDATRSELTPLAIITAGLLALTQLAGAIAGQIRFVISERVTRHATEHFLDISAKTPYEEFLKPAFHNRFALAGQGAAGSAWNVVYGVVQLLSSVPPIIAIAVVIARIDPVLALILALAELPSFVTTGRSARLARAFSEDLAGSDRERFALFNVLTSKKAAAELRAHQMSPTLGQRHDDHARHRLAKVVELSRKRGVLVVVGSVASAVGLAVALLYVVDRTVQQSLTVGDAGIAVVALQQLASRLRSIGQGVGLLAEQSFFVEYLFDDSFSRHDQSSGGPSAPFEGVELRSVTYRYPGASTQALKGLDLEIEPGELVAIVGPNGAGKTTAFATLQGLLPPESGTFLWRAGTPAELGAVLQDPIRFELVVSDVIALGRPNEPFDADRARWALHTVGMDRVLDLDDRLGAAFAGGRDLSGGQWQRLAVARALYRQADVLLLDEPGAHLDPDAELALFQELRSQVDDKQATVIVSTHRASTLRFADRVLMIEDGRVVSDVSGAKALEAGPIAELFAAQLR